jgi:hypothetical protein
MNKRDQSNIILDEVIQRVIVSPRSSLVVTSF